MKIKFNILLASFMLAVGSFQAIAQTAKAVPYFRNGEAQSVSAFFTPEEWIKEDVWVETTFDSDGDGKMDRMHVFLTRPTQTQTDGLKLPVIYMTSPYFAGVGGNSKKYFWNVNHELGATPKMHEHPNVKRKEKRPREAKMNDNIWIRRGYITVYSSSPGTGFSDGSPTIGGENESLAPKAVIDWLCGRAKGYKTRKGTDTVEAFWSTGKIGMTGTSYNGSLCLAAAVTGVEGLEAIIPVAPVSSWYKYYRSNGLVRSPGGYLGEDMDVLYDFVHSGDKSNRKRNNKEVRDKVLVPGQDRLTGDYNDFWATRDYLSKIGNMKAAMLMSHGFNDWNVMPEQSLRMYQAALDLELPTRIYYHQRGHGGPPPFDMMNKWFTRYLHGVKNGVEDEPNAWIVREGDKFPTAYAAYPDPAAEMVTLHLQPSNLTMGKLSLMTGETNQKETFEDDSNIAAVQHLNAVSSENRLLFATDELKEDVRISGTPKITLKMSCNKMEANISVYLVTIPTDENSGKIKNNIITRGWIDPQNRNSLTTPEPLKAGEFYTVEFELMPDDQVIQKGKKIALMIFSSDSEFTLLPEKGARITLDIDETSIVIPVVGGSAAFGDSFPLQNE